MELSDTARLLEEVSKQENEAELQEMHPAFATHYQSLTEQTISSNLSRKRAIYERMIIQICPSAKEE